MRAIQRFPSAVVAYSGGVDSTVVAVAAFRALGSERMLAVTGDSPSVARSELHGAEVIAKQAGFSWATVQTKELGDARYQANDGSRCYFCKSELYAVLDTIRDQRGFAVVMDGFNQDDLGDFRPGLKAGQEHQVVSPLKEAGLGKDAVRRLARAWGLSNWDKPASPCLASRIPYHTPVTVERLKQVEVAEDALHSLGFRQVRVRHHGALARIEVPIQDLPAILTHREAIVRAIKQAGYRFVALDLDGLKSGSLNTLITESAKKEVHPHD
ncbi:ATP-dependent sacrificial sulfur transferase LarE [Sulfobacillus harzensis]|uniref:ATP-dependent sacrificial sulfur transferase LarE n=1 Tax=Sulfobacillus harzensis TaxID=2729629 RepID=A0A7Y0L186_9FIRM|nr:ATP-dependent sacrificial sulfur transferase LarE [Sulfobacillus harzensis]NMP21370.1 ATP-dependent sacrificial sulfur transferase LarE [Sulfobacillus harzensis]